VKKAPVDKGNDDAEDYDEEDSKIISETKKKGYCYFNRKLSQEENSLIGDITPKTVSATAGVSLGPSPAPAPAAANTQVGVGAESKVEASSWNHAGTWEERDLTKVAKDRVSELLGKVDTKQSADTSKLAAELGSITMTSEGGEDGGAGHTAKQQPAAYGKVTKVSTVEGDAHIVLARGKKRHIFDLTIDLEVEVEVEYREGEEVKSKSYKGTLKLTDASPTSNYDSTVAFKKSIPSQFTGSVNKAVSDLQRHVTNTMKAFELEFKNM